MPSRRSKTDWKLEHAISAKNPDSTHAAAQINRAAFWMVGNEIVKAYYMLFVIRKMVLAIALGGLAGCGSLYHAGNDKAAQEASKAFGDAGIGKALEAERTALIRSQSERQQLVKRSELALRDASMAFFIDAARPESAWGALKSMTDARIADIVGGLGDSNLGTSCSAPNDGRQDSPLDASRDKVKAADQLPISRLRRNLEDATINANQKLSQIAIEMAKFDDAAEFSCASQPSVLPEHLQGVGNLVALVSAFDTRCRDVVTANRCISDLSKGTGLLGKTQITLTEIAAAKVGIAKDVSERRKVYTDLLAKADKEKGTAGVAADLASELESALEAIGKVESKTNSVMSNPVLSRFAETGKMTALTEKKKVLEAYIAALSGTASEKPMVAEHRVLLVSRLVNRLTARRLPPTAGILMEAELNRQQIALSESRIERATQAERIILGQRDHLLDELGFLQAARTQIADAAALPSCVNKPLYAGLASGVANPCSMHASKALLSFAGAWTAGRIPVEQADYLRIDLAELAALDESEAALQQTEGVIKAAMVQIALLHAGGIKPEQISAVAQALGLPAIALRIK